MYLGHSPCHADSVALVLNPRTLHVSPQFHVVFDNDFTTVPFRRDQEQPPHWFELVRTSTELTTDEHFDLGKRWCLGEVNKTSITPIDTLSSDTNDGALHSPGDSRESEGGAPPSEGNAPSSKVSQTL